jgi:Leucine-rich repeat (LRR) protein
MYILGCNSIDRVLSFFRDKIDQIRYLSFERNRERYLSSENGFSVFGLEKFSEVEHLIFPESLLKPIEISKEFIKVLSRFKKIKTFQIADFKLDHEIKDEFMKTIANFDKLENLALKCNGSTKIDITGQDLKMIIKPSLLKLNLRELSIESFDLNLILNLKNLTELDLSGVEISPLNWVVNPVCGFSALTKLTKLVLSHCSLEEENLSDIGQLNNLTALNLSDNKIENSFLPIISNLTNLTKLNLSNCVLNDFDFNFFKPFTKLTELNLNGNDLGKSKNVSTLWDLPHLTILKLSQTGILDKYKMEIKNPIPLKQLDLSFNEIKDKNIGDVSGLVNIEKLDLCFNELSSETLEKIAKLRNLVQLNWLKNSLGSAKNSLGSAMEKILQLPKLRIFRFNKEEFGYNFFKEIKNKYSHIDFETMAGLSF